MTLLDHYLRAVRLYLPKGAQQDDILSELAEHLQSSIEERETTLGRPLTEAEQEVLLTGHGDPMTVAARYGARNRSVAFGRQLIGPELFPLYSRILLANWIMTAIVLFAIQPFVTVPLTFWNFATPMSVQFAIVTIIFTAIDTLQRRSRQPGSWMYTDSNWSFPPPYFQRIPRWQSVTGGLVLGLALLWWIAVAFAPSLLLGRAAGVLEIAPSMALIYWPVLVVLILGVAQRIATALRPDLNWLQSATRLVTNGTAVALLYPFAKSYPYVIVSSAAPDVAAAEKLARIYNGSLWWIVLASFSLYWLINAGFHLWMCIQHIRHLRRGSAQVA